MAQFAWLAFRLWESTLPLTDASSQWKEYNLFPQAYRAGTTLEQVALAIPWIFSAFAINFPFRCSWEVDGYRPSSTWTSQSYVCITAEEIMERPHLRPGQLNTWPLDYWHECEVVFCMWNQARKVSPDRPLAGIESQSVPSSRKAGLNPFLSSRIV